MIGTEFIAGLPKLEDRFDPVTTLVDRLSKIMYFVRTKSTKTALNVAGALFDMFLKQYGLSESILADLDICHRFESWKMPMERNEITLKMSASCHHQTRGVLAIMKRMVENYLKCYCS